MNGIKQINLHSLPKIVFRGKKRVGRGYGSGKGGHTSGRGQKGQLTRRTVPWSFEGGGLPLSQRLPFWRGKGRLNPLSDNPVSINLSQLDTLATGTIVDAGFLVKKGWVKSVEIATRGAKILGGGKLTKKLTIVGLRISVSAKAAVEKAGGKVEEKVEKVEKVKKVEKAKKVEKVKKSEMTKTVEKKKIIEHKTVVSPAKSLEKEINKPPVKTSLKKKSMKKASK